MIRSYSEEREGEESCLYPLVGKKEPLLSVWGRRDYFLEVYEKIVHLEITTPNGNWRLL